MNGEEQALLSKIIKKSFNAITTASDVYESKHIYDALEMVESFENDPDWQQDFVDEINEALKREYSSTSLIHLFCRKVQS